MVRQLGRRSGHFGRRAIDADVPDVHRLGDVLEPLRPDRRQLDIDLAAHLLVDGARDADTAGRRKRFQPRRDIDAVAEDVFAVDDDVANIDPHAQA